MPARRRHLLANFPGLVGAVLAACTAPTLRAAAPAFEHPEATEDNWVIAPKNYASTRYSTLDEITTGNVAKLQVAWTFSTGLVRGHEAAPLVVGDTMYVVTPYPNYLYALDLSDGGALKWRHEPNPARSSQGVACCDVVNRGAAWWEGKVIYNTLDAHVVAVDAATGKEAWKTKVGDINKGESMTMAPLVVKGKVLVGNSGGEFGVRGWLKALDASDGKALWTAYSTGPDAEVLIGPDFRPHYEQDRGRDLGVTTWPPDAWRIGGGTVWGWISYDPELNLIYYGTGNPGPWNPEQRPGDNKWTCGIFARDPDTGQAKWFYQFSPHDLYDWDGVNEQILLDLEIEGRPRKVLLRPERNGFIYILDRATGRFSPPTTSPTTPRPRTSISAPAVRSTSRPRNPRSARSCATSPRPRRARRTGNPPPTRRAPATSTSRTKTSPWT